MEHSFINRKTELEFLEEAYKKEEAQLLLIYGRRRVGKTYLMKHFVSGKKGVYFLCSEGNETEQISLLSLALAEYFNDTALRLNPFKEWRGLFMYVYEKAKTHRFVLTIDEFPYLMGTNPSIGTLLQKYWDEYFSKTCVFLLLCGSSIGMMESVGIKRGSPLYGRRTGQWKVAPLKFNEYAKLFRMCGTERIVEFYALTGGIAFYANQLEENKAVRENIMSNIAKQGKLLYAEGEILLKEELKDSATYFSILHAIASGKTRRNEIADAIGVAVTSLSRYFATLVRIGYVVRSTPVTDPPNSKRAIYEISDNFLAFWFRYIYPNKGYIEEENTGKVEDALKGLNAYIGLTFEKLCRELANKLTNRSFEKTGKWWGNYLEEGEKKTAEIDIAALDSDRNILFAECKWQDNVDAAALLSELKKKALLVEWNKEKRKESYALFAKSFKKRVDGALCMDLKDIAKILGI